MIKKNEPIKRKKTIFKCPFCSASFDTIFISSKTKEPKCPTCKAPLKFNSKQKG